MLALLFLGGIWGLIGLSSADRLTRAIEEDVFTGLLTLLLAGRGGGVGGAALGPIFLTSRIVSASFSCSLVVFLGVPSSSRLDCRGVYSSRSLNCFPHEHFYPLISFHNLFNSESSPDPPHNCLYCKFKQLYIKIA